MIGVLLISSDWDWEMRNFRNFNLDGVGVVVEVKF